MRVGFIGLGRMGSGLAANLLKAGHQVTVYNRTPGKADALASQGAEVADSIAEVCCNPVVFTMLSNDQAAESVVFGAGGILENLPKRAIHVSSSTISVAMSDRLAAAHANAGQRYVAATVLGRPDVAAEGRLFIVAAGAKDALRKVEPLLDAIGRRTITFGETPSSANLVKLTVKFMIASVMESLGEAIALASKAGIDRKEYFEFLTSTLFDAPVYKMYGALAIDDKPAPIGFPAALGFKDIRLALAAGDDLRVPLPLVSLLHDRFVELLANGGDKMDWSAIGKLALAESGERPERLFRPNLAA